MEKFKAALKLVDEDKILQARGVFERFIEQCPNSQLAENTRQAVEVLEDHGKN